MLKEVLEIVKYSKGLGKVPVLVEEGHLVFFPTRLEEVLTKIKSFAILRNIYIENKDYFSSTGAVCPFPLEKIKILKKSIGLMLLASYPKATIRFYSKEIKFLIDFFRYTKTAKHFPVDFAKMLFKDVIPEIQKKVKDLPCLIGFNGSTIEIRFGE